MPWMTPMSPGSQMSGPVLLIMSNIHGVEMLSFSILVVQEFTMELIVIKNLLGLEPNLFAKELCNYFMYHYHFIMRIFSKWSSYIFYVRFYFLRLDSIKDVVGCDE